MTCRIASSALALTVACSARGPTGEVDAVVAADTLGSDAARHGADAVGDAVAGTKRTILYRCSPFDGGLCRMNSDGGDPDTLQNAGFAPRGEPDGSILFHTGTYRVARRRADGGAKTSAPDLLRSACPTVA